MLQVKIVSGKRNIIEGKINEWIQMANERLEPGYVINVVDVSYHPSPIGPHIEADCEAMIKYHINKHDPLNDG